MKLMKKLFKNSKGYSLIELIVTIAIMSIITVGIGAAVVSATKNYNRGTTEVNVQAAGQNVTNILTNLIIDSAQAYSDADGVTQAVGPKLFIKDVNGNCVCVRYVPSVNPNGTGSLYYGEAADYATAEASTLVLAENITGFDADTTKYKDEYTVHINLELSFPSEKREFKSSFTVTSRNAAADGSYIDNLDSAVIISDTMVMIEPNESSLLKTALAIDCKVITSGSVTDAGLNYLVLNSYNPAATAADNVNGSALTVTYDASAGKFNLVANENINSTDGKMYIRVTTNAIDPATSMPYDTKWITVNIRRVNEVSIIKDKTLSTKTTNQAGSVHVINGSMKALNAERNYALDSDTDYDMTDSNIYDVVWTAEVASRDGLSLSYYIDTIKDSKGVDVTSQVISSSGYKCNVNDTLNITLKNSVPKGDVITFTMTAMHPLGITSVNGTTYVTNKASLAAYNSGVAVKKEYPCSPAVYKITSGFFEEISDYQRGTVLNGKGFNDPTANTVYDVVFKGIHQQYKAMNQNSYDSNGKKVADVNKWLQDFKDGKVSFQVKYFYRIKDYTKDLDGSQITTGWSQFRDMSDSGSNYTFNKAAVPGEGSVEGMFTNGMTNRLNADTYQSVEFVVVIYDEAGKQILWPDYDALMEYGFGPSTSHYGLGWHMGEYAASVTEDYSSYATTFDIVPARIDYYAFGNVSGVGNKEKMIGSTENPLVLGDKVNYESIEYEQGKWIGLDYKEYQNRIAGLLMKNNMDGSGWKKVDYFGEPQGIPQIYECYDGGFKVGSNNHAFVFDTQNISPSTDYMTVYRVAPIIYKWKLGYIKEEEQVFSRNVYYDAAHTYTYLLSGGDYDDDPLQGSVTFKRYGSAVTIDLMLNGEGATCSQSSVTFVAGKSLTLPTPTRSGYAFAGWYTAQTGGTIVSSGATSVSVSKLWAHWIDVSTSPIVLTQAGSTSFQGTYNGSPATITRYTYIIANNVMDGQISFYFTFSGGAKYNGDNGSNAWLQNNGGNEYKYSPYMQKGTSQIITIDVVDGTITGSRYQ